MTKQIKIQKTNRIRFRSILKKEPIVVYCSYDIVREVKDICVKLQNNVMAPEKGKNDELVHRLIILANQRPKQFANSALTILGV